MPLPTSARHDPGVHSAHERGSKSGKAASTGAPETASAAPADARPESRPEGSHTDTDDNTQTSQPYPRGKIETLVISTLPYYIPRAMPACDSPDPRRQAEEHLRELAKQVREHPTLPITSISSVSDALSADKALVLPPKHCAFANCKWIGDTDEELLEHLKADHTSAMQQAVDAKTDQATMDEQIWAVYNHAVGEVCRQAAPTASYSIDRRALRSYTTATSGHNIQEPICFCCARRFPHTSSWGWKQFISWESTTSPAKAEGAAEEALFVDFLGMSYEETESILGLQTYLRRYGRCGNDSPDLTQQLHEFADWTVDAPFEKGVLTLLCCPEDRRCDRSRCQEGTGLCRACEIPICVECRESLRGDPQMPPAALTNDMMVFYLPRELYADKVTTMELLCASVLHYDHGVLYARSEV